jgi:hypothetical protein
MYVLLSTRFLGGDEVVAEVKLVHCEQFAMAIQPPAGLQVRAECVDCASDRAGAYL